MQFLSHCELHQVLDMFKTLVISRQKKKIIVRTGLITFYSRTFPGLFKDFQQYSRSSLSHARYYIFPVTPKKAISVSGNNVIQPKDRIVQNYSFSFSSMELNFCLRKQDQNRMRIMSQPVHDHLQFCCCFCAFHFSCTISMQTLPCFKCPSLDRSICTRLFYCQL